LSRRVLLGRGQVGLLALARIEPFLDVEGECLRVSKPTVEQSFPTPFTGLVLGL
jgi:hypothetical protein